MQMYIFEYIFNPLYNEIGPLLRQRLCIIGHHGAIEIGFIIVIIKHVNKVHTICTC